MKISDFTFQQSSEPQAPVSGTGPADGRSLEQRFSEVARRFPDRPALRDSSGAMTYAELADRSAEISSFILRSGFPAETPVAVLCNRNHLFITAALGILRSGAIYVPLDPALPLLRRQEMLTDCGAALLITEADLIGDAGRLQFSCPALKHLLCLDVEFFQEAVEKPGSLMDMELWSHVSARQPDGSWKSLFDGRPLPQDILQAMAENVVEKNKALLDGRGRVLDVGCGSGAIARALLARCEHYTAVDLSRVELDRLEELAKDYPGVTLDTHQYEALDINLLPANRYDLVVVNSVVENFPGFNYLRLVLNHCMTVLREDGVLFLGCIWDMAKRDDLLVALRRYGEKHDDWSGLIRLERGEELFVPRNFFHDWAVESGMSLELEFSRPDIPASELSDFRFDVSIRRTAGVTPITTSYSRHGFCAVKEKESPSRSAGIMDTDHAAYIIYTSGSTGKPKGVVIEQGSLLNLNDGLKKRIYQPQWGNEPVDIALLASFCFDASIQQIIPCLCEGHTLHIVPDQIRRDPQALHGFFVEQGVAISDGTPSLFSLLLDYWSDHDLCSSVSTFILGGEPLGRTLVERFFAIAGHAEQRIFNAYGPSECTVDSTLHLLTRDNYTVYDSPPIGTPLDNVEISVRDSKGRLLPSGIPGELWICGAGVGRGYFNNNALTEKVFVNHDGHHWYRTGDIGRQLLDGCFVFINRLDYQVKVRGYRIELGEVEVALRACPLVRDAVVVVVDFTGSGEQVLAAYVVSVRKFDQNTLTTWLGAHLPAHAVPTHFVTMEQLPFTRSGKLDRHNLPAPVLQQNWTAGRKPRPLQGAVEKCLGEFWSRLLGIAVDDADLDFFEIGGHSVLAVRLISLIEKEFGRRIPLSSLFSLPTIAGLAELLISGKAEVTEYTPVIPLATEGTGTPIFLFHPVGGHVLCYQSLARHLSGKRPLYAVEAITGRNTTQLPTVESMAVEYLRFIRQVAPRGPYIMAGWSFGGLVAFEVAGLCVTQGEQVEKLVLLDSVADSTMARRIIQKDEAGMLARLLQEQFPVDEKELRVHTGQERINYLIEQGMKHGLLPSGFSVSDMRRLLHTYHVNTLAASRYEPVPASLHGLLIRPETVSRSTLNIPDDPLQGWGNILLGGVDLKWIPGSHESMLMEHTSPELAGIIEAYLETE